MSLINEALKKAQKQRAADEAAKAGAVPPPGAGGLGRDDRGGTPPPRPPAAPPAGDGFADGDPERGGARRTDPLVAARSRRSGGLPRWAVPAGVVVAVLAVGGWWLGGDDAEGGVGNADMLKTEKLKSVASAERVEGVTEPGAPGAGEGTDSTPVEGTSPALPSLRTAQQDGTGLAITAVASQGQTPAGGDGVVGNREKLKTETLSRAQRSPLAEQESAADSRALTPDGTGLASTSVAGQGQAPAGAVPARTAGGGLTILSDREAGRSVQAQAGGAPVEGATNLSGAPASGGPTSVSREAVLQYLERSRVTGVRLSSTDPKVLFNDRVYRLNEIVDRDLQLRITGIADRELTFRDAAGNVYTKSF